MSDLRAVYRAVADAGMWRLEVRHWFWPFWLYVRYAGTIDRARMFAWEHANRHVQVVDLGRFKGEPRP